MKRIVPVLLLGTAIAAILAWSLGHRSAQRATPALVAPAPQRVVTRHFTITSTASPAQTRLVAEKIELLHDAWVAFLGDSLGHDRDKGGLQLILFKDRSEFQAHNDSMPWAEAFYRAPASRAYFASSAANPCHWMLHEVTHQLNDQVAHLKLRLWISEGLASYFGTSAIVDGKLVPGDIDPDTYPIWWLSKMELTGNLQADIAKMRIIPLRTLISESGPLASGEDINLHYIEYWSLTYFLLHGEHGKYAAGYRRLLTEGGSLAAFEATIGPVETIERQWYAYLRGKAADFSPTLIR